MQRGFAHIVLLVNLLILILAIVGVYYLTQITHQKSWNEWFKEKKVEVISQNSSFSDETVSWKTLTNNKFGYAIKYPGSWFVQSPGGGQFGDLCQDIVNQATVEFTKTKLTYCGFVAEQLPPAEAELTLRVFDKEFTNEELSFYPETITLNGVKASKFVFTEKAELPDIQASRIALNHNNKGYLFFLKQTDKQGTYDPIYDKILATFKFLN